MIQKLLCIVFVLITAATVGFAQSNHLETLRQSDSQNDIRIDLSAGDTSFIHSLFSGDFLNAPFFDLYREHTSMPELDRFENSIDSTEDSLIFELRVGKMFQKYGRNHHSFIVTEDPYERLSPFKEGQPILDFNRVNGFVLGLATPMFINFGRHNELGIKAGIAYGFEDEKGQSMLGGEYRIPLGSTDTNAVERWHFTPTLAIGAEYHNITTTEDQWRAGRYENAFYAFFAREDFRDYFKIDGWNADLAFRLNQHSEVRLEYRSDIYYDKPQLVYHGRWGGNKSLPDNPAITTGRINSWVVTLGGEHSHSTVNRVSNIWGDTVTVEAIKGHVGFIQAEFGDNTVIDSSYARFILDARHFIPIVSGLSFDTRLRFASGTGNVPIQKLEYLGGPSTLQAFNNKVFVGNRMLLLNTELRFNLAILSSFFDSGDGEILILNDLGYLNMANPGDGIFAGFGELKPSTIAYNVGVGFGNASGGQIGVMFRTDKKETGRFFLRFQRPF